MARLSRPGEIIYSCVGCNEPTRSWIMSTKKHRICLGCGYTCDFDDGFELDTWPPERPPDKYDTPPLK